MSLSNDLISQFIKATNDEDRSKKKETTVYGTTVEENGSMYVKIDGSDQLTPVSTTAGLRHGERVTVMIKNHSAIVTGNITSPSAPRSDLDSLNYDFTEFGNKISEFEIVIANKVSVDLFDAEVARIDDLVADDVVIKNTLVAANADIDKLQADSITVNNKLTADEADIAKLKTEKLDTIIAEATYATIEELDATNARVYNLEATYGDFAQLDVEELRAISANIGSLDAKYANIDFSNIDKAAMEYFYSTSGLIKDVVVGNATITGKLTGVTISGDLIDGNTVKAEKLVIKGSDGLYYKLNMDGIKVEAQQTDENSINGQIIKAKSITATKIDVEDLVAFDATIGGFNITENSLYSGAKESVNNTTRGIYFDKDGQIAIGDSSNFLKYYKDTDGSYKLAISAKSLYVDGGIGGRNLLSKTKDFSGFYPNRTTTTIIVDDDGFSYINFPAVTELDYRAISSTRSMIPSSDVIGRDIVFSFYWRSETAWTAQGTDILIGFALCNDTSTDRLRYQTVYYTGEIKTEWTRITVKTNVSEANLVNGSGNFNDCTRFYVQIYNHSLKPLQVKKPKVEYGHVATDWTPSVEDVDSSINQASKTASSYLAYDSTNGLQLGNKTSGSWVGFRTQITNAAFRVLSSAGTVLASYGEKLIELGKNATDAVIKLCGGKGQIEYDSTDDCMQLSADNVRLKGVEQASLYSNYTDSNGNFRNGAVHASPGQVAISASGGDDDSSVNVGPNSISMSTENYHISGVMNDSDNGGTYVSITKGTSGIWTYVKYSNGDVEMWGTHSISNVDCTTAMGSMYRNSGAFSPSAFPFTIYSPNVVASYESDGYGAFLWATTTATTAKPPNYYLVRPTSGNIANGKVNFHVRGKWKN